MTARAPGRVARARRRIALQAFVASLLGIMIASATTYLAFSRQHETAIEQRLVGVVEASRAAEGRVPPGSWLQRVAPDGEVERSGMAPHDVPSSQVEQARSGDAYFGETHLDGREYEVLVRLDGRDVVVAGLAGPEREPVASQLVLALLVGGLLASALALAGGWWWSRRAVAPLEQALEREHRFVADASHELKTPLTRMALRAELVRTLAQAEADADEVSQEASLLVSDAQAMSGVIGDLLLTSRMEAGALEGAPVDLAELADSVVLSEQVRAQASGVRLHRAGVGSVTVTGVEAGLSRAVAALVDNAVRHSPEGSQVTVDVERRDDRAVVRVVDQGDGVPVDDRERIFDRFASGSSEGFGLGLSLVAAVVEAHGGRVWLDETYTDGAAFVLSLPRRG